MAFDERKYLKYFDRSNLTEEQKLERIRIYKGILQTFIDAAFGQSPEQLCREPSQEKYLQSQDQELESKKLTKTFKNKTDGPLLPKTGVRTVKKETIHHVKPY